MADHAEERISEVETRQWQTARVPVSSSRVPALRVDVSTALKIFGSAQRGMPLTDFFVARPWKTRMRRRRSISSGNTVMVGVILWEKEEKLTERRSPYRSGFASASSKPPRDCRCDLDLAAAEAAEEMATFASSSLSVSIGVSPSPTEAGGLEAGPAFEV